MTVNHDVTGSSPVGGATAKAGPVFASDNVGRKDPGINLYGPIAQLVRATGS